MSVSIKPIKKNLQNPDDVRNFGPGKMELVHLEDSVIARVVLLPGWSWEKNVKPLVGTDTCEVMHTQYCIQGRLMVRMSDGTEIEIGPGDAVSIPPGHTAYVIGDEAFVGVEFTASSYGRKAAGPSEEWDEEANFE